jgi:hypothetical protein
MSREEVVIQASFNREQARGSMRKQIKGFYKMWPGQWKKVKEIIANMWPEDTFKLTYYITCTTSILENIDRALGKMIRIKECGHDIEVDVIRLDELRSYMVTIVEKIDRIKQ